MRAASQRRQRQIDALRASGAREQVGTYLGGGGGATLSPQGVGGSGEGGLAQLAAALQLVMQQGVGQHVQAAAAPLAKAAPSPVAAVLPAPPTMKETTMTPDEPAAVSVPPAAATTTLASTTSAVGVPAPAPAPSTAPGAATASGSPLSPVVRRHRPTSPLPIPLSSPESSGVARTMDLANLSVTSVETPASQRQQRRSSHEHGDDSSSENARGSSGSGSGTGRGGDESVDLSTDFDVSASDGGDRFGFGIESDASGLSSFGS